MSATPGDSMLSFARELYPICRSITGNGARQTLRAIQQRIPIELREVPTGTQVFDWKIPKEWNIRDAYIKNARGERVVDFQKCNLHVLNYSAPIQARMRLAELRPHLFTLPEHPTWIPYRTSYYAERWGFCLRHDQLESMPDEEYEVCIDASLEEGSLSYGELLIPGDQPDEVLVSSHICHPSLANDNLSGISVATFAADAIRRWPNRRYSYRFLFIPGTIGSITWLARNESAASRIKHGLVLSCVGDGGHSTYKRSRRGDAEIDRAVLQVLRQSGGKFDVQDFVPYGYDERQYCSPGFNLPVGCFMRTPNGRYPEYHTSADNLDLLKPESLADSVAKVLSVFFVLEHNRRYLNLNPKCEPQLGKRGLYQTLGGAGDGKAREMALLWVLNLSDGNHSLLDVADRSGLDFKLVQTAAAALKGADLLKECP
jgi:aminopeptidase-like protein